MFGLNRAHSTRCSARRHAFFFFWRFGELVPVSHAMLPAQAMRQVQFPRDDRHESKPDDRQMEYDRLTKPGGVFKSRPMPMGAVFIAALDDTCGYSI